MEIEFDGYKLDIRNLSKKIIINSKNNELTYILDFPPHTSKHKFENENELKQFLNKIKNNKDKVAYI